MKSIKTYFKHLSPSQRISVIILLVLVAASLFAIINTVYIPHSRTISVDSTIDFKKTIVLDCSISKGTIKISTAGETGVETTTYTATYINGKEQSRHEISTQTTKYPVNEIDSVGIGRSISPETDTSCLNNATRNYQNGGAKQQLNNDINTLMNLSQ